MHKKLIILTGAFIILAPIVLYFAFPGVVYNIFVQSARRSAGLSQKVITVDKFTIAYLEGGKGDTILLLHGFGGDKDNWTIFAKSLTPYFHVVAIDIPGFGKSSKIPTESYTIGNQVKRIRNIVDTLGLTNFHLAGNSMGGTIAGKYAADVPDRVLSLALFNTGGIYSAEKSDVIKLLERGENPFLIDSSRGFDRMMALLFEMPPPIPRRIRAYLTEQAISSRDFNKKIWNELAGELYSLESDLPRIRAETFIVWGEKDRILHVSSTRILEMNLSRADTIIIEGCGHVPMLEKPHETAEYYLEFLNMVR
ncbi:MAG TPA: alpha/beta fold hydrolase [Deltaproteobacteria bacterium]|nr:alpha/beta fold hydrolase [Deltaproteobacteria bacterium]